MKKKVENTWKQIWDENKNDIPSTNSMALEIGNDILKWIDNLEERSSLEVGSGTGIISALLVSYGFKVTLLDISETAIKISKNVFIKNKINGDFILGDLFNMPFENNTFDLVWNAGVLEHFEGQEQIAALREMARVTKPGGMLITYNPYYRAIFYRIGKWRAERFGKWEFGPEIPVKSLKNKGNLAGLVFIKEYPICAKEQLGFLDRYIFKGMGKIIRYTTGWVPEQFWMQLFGGYLLVSVFRKLEKVTLR